MEHDVAVFGNAVNGLENIHVHLIPSHHRKVNEVPFSNCHFASNWEQYRGAFQTCSSEELGGQLLLESRSMQHLPRYCSSSQIPLSWTRHVG